MRPPGPAASPPGWCVAIIERARPFCASASGVTSSRPMSASVHDGCKSGQSVDGTSDSALTAPIGRASGSGRPREEESFGSAARAEARHGSPFAFRQSSRSQGSRAGEVRVQSPGPGVAFSQRTVPGAWCRRPILMEPGIRRRRGRAGRVRLKGHGSRAAQEEIRPGTRRQRCRMHESANVQGAMAKSVRPKAGEALHDIRRPRPGRPPKRTGIRRRPTASMRPRPARDVLRLPGQAPAQHAYHQPDLRHGPPPDQAAGGLPDRRRHASRDLQARPPCPGEMETAARLQGAGEGHHRSEVQRWHRGRRRRSDRGWISRSASKDSRLIDAPNTTFDNSSGRSCR